MVWQAQRVHIEACTAAASPTQWSCRELLQTTALDKAAPVIVSLVPCYACKKVSIAVIARVLYAASIVHLFKQRYFLRGQGGDRSTIA